MVQLVKKAMSNLSSILILGFLILSLGVQAQRPKKAFVDKDGIPVFKMDDVTITSTRVSKKRAREFQQRMKKFNKLRYNVLKVWPYAQAASENLMEINADLAKLPEEERRSYLKTRENNLFGKYESNIRDLSFSQGKVLIKLIDRQTGDTTYRLIQDLKNGTSAFFWQAIGRLFGYNLKSEYDPKGDDFEIEVIVQSIEKGVNITYYDIYEVRGF